MNRFTAKGRIVNDLELKTTPNGTSVCKFRIAVDRNYQQKGEERKADFFNAVAWRGNAEFLTKYFAKGRLVLIEGEMQTTAYTDKNGNNATWYEIVCEHIYFTGEKAQIQKIGGNEPPPPTEPPQFSGADSDDYPF